VALEKVGFDHLPIYLEPERAPGRGSKEFQKKYPLILSTGIRSIYYTHSQHRGVAALRGTNPEPLFEISSFIAQKYGVRNGDDVVAETNRGKVRMKARVDERVEERVVLVPHCWPGEASANLLTDAQCREPLLGNPDMKSFMCSIRKA
jgi:formate dehydrogenase (coenzyme F420) alpha subunit